MLKSLSTSLIWRGVLVGSVPSRRVAGSYGPRPRRPVRRVRLHVGRVRSADARSGAAPPVRSSGIVALGLVDFAAGVVASSWPGPTALVLVLLVASWAIVTGVVEVFAAFGAGEEAGTRAMFIIGGLVSVAFGVVLFARPDMGAISLALLFGLFNLIAGSWMLVRGIELRRTDAKVHSLAAPTEQKVAA